MAISPTAIANRKIWKQRSPYTICRSLMAKYRGGYYAWQHWLADEQTNRRADEALQATGQYTVQASCIMNMTNPSFTLLDLPLSLNLFINPFSPKQPSPKRIRHNTEPIFCLMHFFQKQVVPVRQAELISSKFTDNRVLSSTDGTLWIRVR